MADTLKRMYLGQPGTANATLYTAPSTAVVRTLQVANTTATAATITLNIVPSGGTASAANRIISAFSVPANGLLVENINVVLSSGDTIQGSQVTASALTAVISGIET